MATASKITFYLARIVEENIRQLNEREAEEEEREEQERGDDEDGEGEREDEDDEDAGGSPSPLRLDAFAVDCGVEAGSVSDDDD